MLQYEALLFPIFQFKGGEDVTCSFFSFKVKSFYCPT